MPYYFAYGPLPIKVFDRRSVMLDGPPVPGGISVMVVSRPDFAAVESSDGLTQRQHAVARLLGDDLNDDRIAELLGVSVRTVRNDVARLLVVLGASTRFSAGLRYARITGPPAGAESLGTDDA